MIVHLVAKPITGTVLAVSAFCLCAGLDGPPNHDVTALHFKINAASSAEFSLTCRYPTYRIWGQPVNTIAWQHTGPLDDMTPDLSRCTLRKLSGPGPVTLTIFKHKAYSATVAKPGEEAKVFVY